MLRALACAALLALIPATAIAAQEQPIDVSPCELAKDPPKYDRKLVRVRSRVSLAFEEFDLYPTECPDARFDIWLELGGDVEAPTIYCCGDHSRTRKRNIQVEGFNIPLLKDASFEGFYNHLTATRKANPDGSLCYDRECYMYDVTATLMGRFFAAKGYGHMGLHRLLAIQQVADVEAIPTGVPGGEVVCSQKVRVWDDSLLSPVSCEADDTDDCLAELLMQEAKGFWQDGVTLAYRPGMGTDREGALVSHEYEWRTRDGLISYKLDMQKRCDSKWDWDKCPDKPWTMLKLTRVECTPKH